MRLTLRHETNYDYAEPARGAIQVLRLTPRNHATQFVRRWRVEIDADCRLDRDEDAYGNITHTFSIDGSISALRILVDGEVDIGGGDGLVRGTVERFPLGFWLSTTPLSTADAALEAYSAQLERESGGDRLDFLHRLMARIHEDFAFVIGETDIHTPAAAAFAAKKGVCQDFSQVFIAAARAAGIPARYVGGYFLRTDQTEQEAGHAWAEAHVPDLGWIGFDPANCVCADRRHIRIAIGRDYLEASPIRGARIGGGQETLDVHLSLQEGRALREQ